MERQRCQSNISHGMNPSGRNLSAEYDDWPGGSRQFHSHAYGQQSQPGRYMYQCVGASQQQGGPYSSPSLGWHPAGCPTVLQPSPYAVVAPASHMPGPVYYAAPACFHSQQLGTAVFHPAPHYWVPMMISAAPFAMSYSQVPADVYPSNSPEDYAGPGRGAHSGSTDADAGVRGHDACSASGQSEVSHQDSSWNSLTAGILQNIMSKLGDGEMKHMRSVCRHWRGVVDHNLEALTPNELHAKVIVQRFPNLKVLHLTNCCNIRNRSLGIIAGLGLHTLTLGDDTCKPWITNAGLACIAQMTSLTSLNLHDCSSVTNNGLLALTKLQSLSSLSLKGCRKLTNCAFEALHGHSALTSLNLYGCRLTDQGLLPLVSLQLVSLHLGNTRVKDEGLAYLAQITTLQELHFDQENLTDAGVAQLTALTRLESLALRECAGVSGDSLSMLIPAMPNLISLDLYKNFTMDDSELTRCMEFLGAVTYLDLRGTPVTEDGLQQLTKLSSLQKLCLAPTKECLWSPYLCVVSNLTQLTSLSINNCTLISFGQLETLRQLKLLRELDLSHDSITEEEKAILSRQPVNPTAINAMAAITSLTSIDLSRRPVHQEHLSTLAERLPRLHNLIIVGCPVLYTEIQALQRRFPDLVIHRKPLFDVSSCSSSDHGVG